MNIETTIIDYEMGNLWSIKNALTYLNCPFVITGNPEIISKSKSIILPGVGSYKSAMSIIRSKNIDLAIKEAIKNSSKLLGICLGMQLLARSSLEEGYSEGLGIIDTEVNLMKSNKHQKCKIPHIGFNNVRFSISNNLYKGLKNSAYFYFVHSYSISDKKLFNTNALCNYGEDFLASYEKDNIFATQYHPEKSQTNGLLVLKNFLDYKNC